MPSYTRMQGINLSRYNRFLLQSKDWMLEDDNSRAWQGNYMGARTPVFFYRDGNIRRELQDAEYRKVIE